MQMYTSIYVKSKSLLLYFVLMSCFFLISMHRYKILLPIVYNCIQLVENLSLINLIFKIKYKKLLIFDSPTFPTKTTLRNILAVKNHL